MEKPSPEISPDRRYNLLCIPWILTAVVTFPGVLHPLFFPAGLYRLFGIRETDAFEHGWWLLFGWLAYIGLTVAACFSRRKRTYFAVYAVLCVFLALNSVGCRAFWSEMSHVE